MEYPETTSFTRRKLPHWRVVDRPYFVTFRLKGSLPRHIVEELKNKKDDLIKQEADNDAMHQYQRYAFKRLEEILDNTDNKKNCFLIKPEIASLIMNAFEFLENKYCWRFPSFVVMPNHIHCLAIGDKTGIKRSLVDTIGYLKSFVAKEGNKILDRLGTMWVDENFDHWCRTPDKVEGVVKYIRNNPVKAKLVDKIENWKWVK